MQKDRILTIALCGILMLSLIGCDRGNISKRFAETDSIADANPAKAIETLRSMRGQMKHASRRDRMRYALLCIKAETKAGIEQRSDSTIKAVIKYYKMQDNGKMLTEAYYYAGHIYRDWGNIGKAAICFQKAANLGQGNKRHSEIACDAALQYALLLSDLHVYDEALTALRKSYHGCEILKGTAHMAKLLERMGNIYTIREKEDSDLICYERVLQLARAANDKKSTTNLLRQIADCHIKRGNIVKAEECIQSLPGMDSADYRTVARLHMAKKEYSEASSFYERQLTIGNIEERKDASRNLMAICANMGEYALMSGYAQLYMQYADSADSISRTEDALRAHTLYNFQNADMDESIFQNTSTRRVICFAIIFLLCVFFIAKFSVRNLIGKRRQRDLLIQIETLRQIEKENYERSESYIRENKRKIEVLEQQLHGANDMNTELVRQLEKQKSDLMIANENAEREQDKKQRADNALTKSDAWDIIEKRLEQGKMINESDWETIDESVNGIVENFKLRLYSLYRLSAQEYRVCLLVRLGVSASEISSLIGRSASAVSLLRKRLYMKMFKKEGTQKDFDEFIKSL